MQSRLPGKGISALWYENNDEGGLAGIGFGNDFGSD
jgi:hypothetical protein